MSDLQTDLQSLSTMASAEILAENVQLDKDTNTYQFNDRDAVKLVVDDASTADNFINVNQWASGWTLSDILIQSPSSESAFDGGSVTRASVSKFMLSNHISAIVPKIMGGLFYEDPPFLLRPRPETTQDVVRAKTALFTSQLEFMGFQEEAERALFQMSLLGTCILKWGWAEYEKTIKRYVRKGDKTRVDRGPETTPAYVDNPDSDDFTVEYETKLVSHPWLKYTDIRTVLVDPGTRVGDIRKANWVIYRDYATYQDLERLRGVAGYEIPDEPTLKRLFFSSQGSASPDNISMTITQGMMGYLQHAMPRSYKTSADPLKTPMEILERWDNERIIVVLSFGGHNILIRNEANPYGKIPFLSANWRDLPDSFYGQGLGILIGSEQLVEQGVTNLALDLLAYGLQPTAVRKKGFQVPTQDIEWSAGGIIDVEEDVDKAFKFLTMPPVPSEAWQAIAAAKSSGAETSGANEQVVQGAGSAGIKTTGMRSATGASAVIAANASRLDGPTSRFVNQVFEPWLYMMDELNSDLLPTKVLHQILGDELGQVYMKNKVDHIEFRSAKIEYEVLAGAKLGAKKEMAQALPMIIQLLNNPTFVQNCNDAGWEFDAPAIFKAFVDAAGWKFSQNFLKQMTPERAAEHKANSPAALQAKQLQAQQQMATQKFEAAEKLEDQKQLGKAAGEQLRLATEHSLAAESGQPVKEGFGAETTY
jgi:hypothetical protein